MIHAISKALGPRKGVFLSDHGKIKIGNLGKAMHPKEALAKLTKGERRRIRKDMHKAGHRDIVLASL